MARRARGDVEPSRSRCRPPRADRARAVRSESEGSRLDWLRDDEDQEALDAELCRVRRAQPGAGRPGRGGRADPTLRAYDRALVARVGYGAGDAVADGRFAEALELPRPGARRGEAVDGVARGALRGAAGRPRARWWPRSWCCAPAPTSTPVARARRRCRRVWRWRR